MNKTHHILRSFSASVLFFLLLAAIVPAQTEAEATEAFTKGAVLMKAGRFKDAIPYLATAAKGFPNDPDVRMGYGIALTLGSKQMADPEEAKKLAGQALAEFQAAKQLGAKGEELDTFIDLLSGGSGLQFSNAGKASPGEKYMQEAESLFTQSKYAEALKSYQKALDADPKLYEAALYMGDAYVSLNDWDNAEKAYQKAIAIDPMRETAYRYSATPLMKQKKYDLARDRYIEAYITDPYDQRASGGISQWAQVTGAKLGHPKVNIPKFGYGADGKPSTVINETALTEGSKAWLAYSLIRDSWHKEKFAKVFPNEKAYRHTLQEEAEAVRETLKSAKTQKLSHPDFEVLQKLDSEGLLEAFILLAAADEGIAQDHPAYLKDNRAKLRQYVLNYAIHK